MRDDEYQYMKMAIDVAAKSRAEDYRARPKVGAVLVLKGKVLGTGFRGENGKGDHAEYTVLEKKVREDAVAGATMYTTLEPCTTRHDPDKIPCAERLYGRRIARVVIGTLDPNQLIRGRGVRRLRQAGIAVELFPPDLMELVEDQNRDFIHYHETAIQSVSDSLLFSRGLNLINPSYDRDMDLLDKTFRREAIISNESVVIVPGTGLVADLLDRPTAGLLRDEIDARGDKKFRRALIVSNDSWQAEAILQRCTTVAIGGENVNPLTKSFIGEAAAQGHQPWRKSQFFGVFANGPHGRPRIALWGGTAEQTRAAVEDYIRHQDGLAKLLPMIWK